MIKAAVPAFDPQHELILEGHGHHPDKVIADTDTVSLEVGERPPVKHFFSKRPTSFRSLRHALACDAEAVRAAETATS